MRWTKTPSERFWDKVDKNGPVPAHKPELGACWVWTSSTDDWGYGTFFRGDKNVKANRHCYSTKMGVIPDGHLVCHHCDNPPCVNPTHLFTGYDKDNAQDKKRKGRCNPATGKRNGMIKHPESVQRGSKSPVSKLTEEQVLKIRSMKGSMFAKDVAKIFGVSVNNINAIFQRKTWTHI